MARKPATICVEGDVSFDRQFQRTVNGVGIDLSSVTDVDFAFEDESGTVVHSGALGTGATIVDEIVASTAISGAFTDSGILVVAGAMFETNETRVRRVVEGRDKPGDIATVAGAGVGYDGSFEVLEVIDEDTIRVNATFAAAAAAGTVTVNRDGEIAIFLSDTEVTAMIALATSGLFSILTRFSPTLRTRHAHARWRLDASAA